LDEELQYSFNKRTKRCHEFLSVLYDFVVRALATLHAVAIFIFCSPPNLARQAFSPYYKLYISEYFPQNWSFFAPNPPEIDIHMLARVRTGNANASKWYNISSYLEVKSRNPFSSSHLLYVGLDHAMYAGSAPGSIGNILAAELLIRTSTMVVQEERSLPFDMIQLRIDRTRAHSASIKIESISVYKWVKKPPVARF